MSKKGQISPNVTTEIKESFKLIPDTVEGPIPVSTKVIAPQDTHATSEIDHKGSEIVTKGSITEGSNEMVDKGLSDDLSKRSVNDSSVKEHSVNFSSGTALLEFKTVPKSKMSKHLNFHAQPNKGLYINALYGTNVVSVNLQVLWSNNVLAEQRCLAENTGRDTTNTSRV